MRAYSPPLLLHTCSTATPASSLAYLTCEKNIHLTISSTPRLIRLMNSITLEKHQSCGPERFFETLTKIECGLNSETIGGNVAQEVIKVGQSPRKSLEGHTMKYCDVSRRSTATHPEVHRVLARSDTVGKISRGGEGAYAYLLN